MQRCFLQSRVYLHEKVFKKNWDCYPFLFENILKKKEFVWKILNSFLCVKEIIKSFIFEKIAPSKTVIKTINLWK
jgi:hypothetical protein